MNRQIILKIVTSSLMVICMMNAIGSHAQSNQSGVFPIAPLLLLDDSDNDGSGSNGNPELCDGIDNNGNGLIDSEDPDLVLDQLCENQTGVCEGSLKPATLCISGRWLPCTDVEYLLIPDYQIVEITPFNPDGLDNDCDGEFDEEI